LSDDIRGGLPQHVEKAIADVEARATAEVREALGRDDVVVELDRTPLLSPEKIKKWPDDFRGFGSNVAPKKRRRG
jgi:hypothetical protein